MGEFPYKTTAAILALVVLVLIASVSAHEAGQAPAGPAEFDNSTYINANLILMFVGNSGRFGRDLGSVFGFDFGTWFPYTSIFEIENNINSAGYHSPLYAAGIWLGGKVNDEVRVAVAEYSSEFAPGPMDMGTYMADRPEFHVYKLFADSMEAYPNVDYLDWPTDQGAPLDKDGKPLLLGDQTLWAVYNDANPALHGTPDPGGTDPLGVEVQQTFWAFSDPGDYSTPVSITAADDYSIYMKYKFYNKGINSIEDMYFALWLDPDLGDASDDLVGCDSSTGVLFCYNWASYDSQYGDAPPAIGYRFIHGPVVLSPGDTAVFDDHLVPDHKNLGMSSFSMSVSGLHPDNSSEAYNVMQGLTITGAPYVYNGDTLKYVHSGNPVTGTGDLDFNPSDRRMIGVSGPFDFNPGDSQYVLIKMVVGEGDNNLASITTMREIINLPYYLIPTDADENDQPTVPAGFSLQQNYPNPFNPSTRLDYSLPQRVYVTLDVYNILGRKVVTLVDSDKPAGNHTVIWDGTDPSGNTLATGVYFYRIDAGEYTATKKMILVK